MDLQTRWSQTPRASLFGKAFTYQLEMRSTLSPLEILLFEKYGYRHKYVYSNRQDVESRLIKGQRHDDPVLEFINHAKAAWHNGGLGRIFEITFFDLLKGVVLTHKDDDFLGGVFNEVERNSRRFIDQLKARDARYNGEINITNLTGDE